MDQVIICNDLICNKLINTTSHQSDDLLSGKRGGMERGQMGRGEGYETDNQNKNKQKLIDPVIASSVFSAGSAHVYSYVTASRDQGW